MNGQGSVIWLDNSVGDLWRWNNRKSGHHAVREFFANFGNEKSSHTSSSTTSKRVGDLETLEAITSFCLTTNNVKNLVNQLGTLSVMALGPVVSSTGLSKHKVIRAEELTEWTSADGVHGTGFEINEDGTWNVLVVGRLQNLESAVIQRRTYLVEVDVHTLKLEIRSAIVPVRVNPASTHDWLTYTPDPSRPCSPEMVCLSNVRRRDIDEGQ
jgi:hypothetical protein